jgi:tRNA-splicing ligase RtcB
MVQKHDFKQIDRHLFEVPAGYRKDMRVPARFYADEERSIRPPCPAS